MATLVMAPMVGKILNLVAQVGNQVEEGETILVMEAMKMEIDVVAPASGTLQEINVAPGDSVNPRRVLAVIA